MDKYTEKRPWGKFERFCQNELCTVKIHFIEPNQEWSLQYHNQRDEFWKIIKGKAKVTIDDKVIEAKENDEFFCPKGIKHRIKAKDELVKILEIAFGDFSEDDIVRVEDRYNRK